MTLVGGITLREMLATQSDGKPLLSLPKLEIALAAFEPLASKLDVARVEVDAPQLTVQRYRDGSLNLLQLLGAAPPPEQAQQAHSKATAKGATPCQLSLAE